MSKHSGRPVDLRNTDVSDPHLKTEAWLRERFANLEINDVAWLPDVGAVSARLARQRRRRRIAVSTVASLAIAAAAFVVLPNHSTQEITASDTSTTVPDDATWSSTSSNGFTVQLSRRPAPDGDRLTDAELGNTDFIPVPGVPMPAGCAVADLLTIDVTSPSGQRWSSTYAEYRDRTMEYADRAGAEVLDAAGRRLFSTDDPFDVAIVTGLHAGDHLSLSDTGDGEITAASDHGVAVLAVDPATSPQRSSLMPTVNSADGAAPTSITDRVELYASRSDGTEQRDPNCSNRSIRPDAAPATPEETAAVTDAVHTTLAELPTGKFSGLDLEAGVPALASTTSDVEGVLADAATRAQASNYGSLLSQLVATVSVAQHVDEDTLVARVGLTIVGMTSTVIVDLHRHGDRWQISPQSVCAALVLATTPCRPAP